jgi:hypothetical protein
MHHRSPNTSKPISTFDASLISETVHHVPMAGASYASERSAGRFRNNVALWNSTSTDGWSDKRDSTNVDSRHRHPYVRKEPPGSVRLSLKLLAETMYKARMDSVLDVRSVLSDLSRCSGHAVSPWIPRDSALMRVDDGGQEQCVSSKG